MLKRINDALPGLVFGIVFYGIVEIDKELYMESYYDTASLLYVLKNRVLDEVGYNYSGICVQLRQEQEEAQEQSPRMDEMTL